MKVILLQDVAKIGKRAEVVEVPNGYALNQLIPKGMAQPATKQNRKRVAQLQAKAEQDAAAVAETFTQTVAALQQDPLQITAEANEQGHLYQGIGAKEIAAAATARGHALQSEQVTLSAPIKTLGEHTITLTQGTATDEVPVTITAAR